MQSALSEPSLRVGEQNTGRGRVQQFGRAHRHQAEELDHVELGHQGVRHLDEHLGQPLC